MCITVIITYAESSHRIKHIFDMQCNKLRLKLKKINYALLLIHIVHLKQVLHIIITLIIFFNYFLK